MGSVCKGCASGPFDTSSHGFHTSVAIYVGKRGSKGWDAMGLPFLPFMTRYIQTRLYTFITAAGLTPPTVTERGVPGGGIEGPFLYHLVTLPLAFELARVYLGYTPYPLRSPLINFADNNLLTTDTRHRDPASAGLPTTTDQESAILQLTATYLHAHHLLVHPRKSLRLADVGTHAPHIQRDKPLHLEDTTIHPGVTQATQHHNIAPQTSWTSASPNYPNLPGGTSCLRKAWPTSWKRFSTRPSDPRPYTSWNPKTPYGTLANK